MKNFFLLIIISMFLHACGGQSAKSDNLDTTRLEKPDSESIVSMANIMSEDLARFLREDDIQSAAALCEEGLDNLMYFRESGDEVSADIYAKCLHTFVKKNYEAMEDMATQNYLVKQFMAAVGDSAILSAQRRRWPEEEEIRREPTVEADGPVPSRPAVRHLRKKEYKELDTGGDDYATDEPAKPAPKVKHMTARPAQQSAKGQQVAKPKTMQRPVSATVAKQTRQPAGVKPVAKSASAKPVRAGAQQQLQTAGKKARTNVQGNKQKKRGPILVECKKKTSNRGGAASGEATSSQWYLVRPLD